MIIVIRKEKPYFLSKISLELWIMIDIKKYSLGELEIIYDNIDEETQKWMLDNLYLWFELSIYVKAAFSNS